MHDQIVENWESIHFLSQTGNTLPIPFTASPLKGLTIQSRFQVELIQAENKLMNLIIPDGCKGILIVDRNGSYLYIRLKKIPDEKQTAALVLQISDTRLNSLLLDNGTRMKAAGTLGWSQVASWGGSELDPSGWFAGQYSTRLFGECEVDKSDRHTPRCIAYVMNQSRLHSQVQELHCCHSAQAIVQNSHPQAMERPIQNQISLHRLGR